MVTVSHQEGFWLKYFIFRVVGDGVETCVETNDELQFALYLAMVPVEMFVHCRHKLLEIFRYQHFC